MQTNDQDIHNSEAQLLPPILEQQDMVSVELLAGVNHVLRTPLMAIKGAAQTLLLHEQQLSSPECREFLQMINEASDELASVINHLLEGAQVNTDNWRIEIVPILDITGLCCPLR